MSMTRVSVDDPTDLFICPTCGKHIKPLGRFQNIIVHTRCVKCGTEFVLSPDFMKRYVRGEVEYKIDYDRVSLDEEGIPAMAPEVHGGVIEIRADAKYEDVECVNSTSD